MDLRSATYSASSSILGMPTCVGCTVCTKITAFYKIKTCASMHPKINREHASITACLCRFFQNLGTLQHEYSFFEKLKIYKI